MSRLVLVNRYFHPDESATSQFLTDLARHLAGTHEVRVLASRQLLVDARARLPARARLDHIQIHRLWSPSFGRQRLLGRLLDYLGFSAAVATWLLLHARRGDTVLAKTDPPVLGFVTTLATLGRGVTRVQWLQDLYPETAVQLGVLAPGGLAARLVRALRDWSLRRSALVVTVSAGMLEHLRSMVGTARLVHIPNWADDYASGQDCRPADARSESLVVGYSGNLGHAHPIDGLLQLAEGRADPAVRFLFTGGGVNHERLRARVRQLGRTNWTFLPYQPREQLPDLLRRPDLHLVILDPRVERFIFPSKVYGILSAGRPIVHLGDPNGELARLLREQQCGWSLTAESGQALGALLETLRADPDQLQAASRNARRAYERSYSRSRALAAWEAALRAAGARTV